MEKNTGIVLKTYLPQKCKISVFDRELGKIVGVPTRTDLSSGSCITYFTHKSNSVYFIQAIEIIDMPMALAHDDILFLHHVLELCYYFIPAGSPMPRLFNLLLALYTSEKIIRNVQLKKIFLFQLFSMLGLYPEGSNFQTPYFHRLALTSIDMVELQTLDLVIEQELDAWLLSCIAVHPCAHNFKTVSFLYDNRIV